MNSELATFLQHHTPVAKQSLLWNNGTMPLEVTSYLGQELPPLPLISSVRAVVLRGEQVLVVRDPEGCHILPGGRREANETLLQTLQRELHEETGWSLSNSILIGFLHFHHLGPYQPIYPTYPDFLQVVYCGQAKTFHPEAREQGGYELEANFYPCSAVADLHLSTSELAFLDAALQAQSLR